MTSRESGEDRAPIVVPHARSAPELKEIIAAERRGEPFLLWRAPAGEQMIYPLDAIEEATIGRRPTNTIAIDRDDHISRTHAELKRVGGEWTVADDGLSSNGTFVNAVRIGTNRRRLRDGDLIRVGRTAIEYRCPAEGSSVVTACETTLPIVENITDTQRRVLVALCRPYKHGGRHVTPASNREIAQEVFLGVDAVKNHLRVMFQRFEIADFPQIQKRTRLVECAFQWGLVSESDL
jgi:hypothetical protein